MYTKPEDYLKEPYARVLIPNDDGSYSAEIFEFPGCFAEGETADEALSNLEESAKSWIEVCIDRHLEIPEPSASQGYNGKIALRLPRSLHRQAVRMADRDNVSLNQFLVTAIGARLGAEELYEHIARKLEYTFKITTYDVIQTYALFRGQTAVLPTDNSLLFEGLKLSPNTALTMGDWRH